MQFDFFFNLIKNKSKLRKKKICFLDVVTEKQLYLIFLYLHKTKITKEKQQQNALGIGQFFWLPSVFVIMHPASVDKLLT